MCACLMVFVGCQGDAVMCCAVLNAKGIIG